MENSIPDSKIAEMWNKVIDSLILKIDEAWQGGDCGRYISLGGTISETDGKLREFIQDVTRSQIVEVLKKLKSGLPLSHNDLLTIRLWVIGDAESYIATENHFQEWLNEIDRLKEEIRNIRSAQMSTPQLSKLRALLANLARTVQQMVGYLEGKERIRKFETATEIIDPDERKTLIDILQRKLESPLM